MALEWLEFAFIDNKRKSLHTPVHQQLTDSKPIYRIVMHHNSMTVNCGSREWTCETNTMRNTHRQVLFLVYLSNLPKWKKLWMETIATDILAMIIRAVWVSFESSLWFYKGKMVDCIKKDHSVCEINYPLVNLKSVSNEMSHEILQ